MILAIWTLSDISGMDIEVHENEPELVVKQVRDWLNVNHGAARPLPGWRAIMEDHQLFLNLANGITASLRLDGLDELSHADYLHIAERALVRITAARALPAERGED